MTAGGIRTGELARAAGVGVQTVRFYERRGLLAPPRRTPGGTREYTADDVRRLRLVRSASALGFTLDEIGRLLRRGGDDLREAAAERLDAVDAEIARLQERREALVRLVDAACDDLEHCRSPETCPLPADVVPPRAG